jgi:hypothetical protein
MKTFIAVFVVVVLSFCGVRADNIIPQRMQPAPNVLDTTDFSVHSTPTVIITDPYRIIDGKVEKVDGSWLAIAGVVKQVHPNEGIRVQGIIENVNQEDQDFFLVNFPYPLAEGDKFPKPGYVYLFKSAGVYTYSTAANSTRTIHKYDYGIPWTPPPMTDEQRAAIKAKNDAAKIAGLQKALKYNQELADKGDAYGLMRMAERYRDGEGVEKDIQKAKDYFIKAKSAGSNTAAKELEKLDKSETR